MTTKEQIDIIENMQQTLLYHLAQEPMTLDRIYAPFKDKGIDVERFSDMIIRPILSRIDIDAENNYLVTLR